MLPFRNLSLAGLVCAGLFAATVDAQPPGTPTPRGPMGQGPMGPMGPGGPPSGFRGPMGPSPFARSMDRPQAEPKVDAQVENWVRTLLEKITDPHDTIRDSARAGVVAVGRPALPMLQNLANGSDAARATAARKLIQAIEQPPRPNLMAMGSPNPRMNNPEPGNRGPEGNPFRGEPQRRPDAGPMGERRPEERRSETPPRGEQRRPEGEPRRPEAERPPEAARPGPGGPIAEVLKSMDLNEKQRKQVGEILESQRKKIEEVGEKIRKGEADRSAMLEVRERILKELKEVLSREQFEKLNDKMNEFGPPNGGPGRGRGERPNEAPRREDRR